jgi:hypothetical protein
MEHGQRDCRGSERGQKAAFSNHEKKVVSQKGGDVIRRQGAGVGKK